MRRRVRSLVPGILAAVLVTTTAMAADREAITQKVRSELATLLKKDAAKLPLDEPVLELGADDLTVVEWVMAIERTYRIRIPDNTTTDPKTRTTRKDLTIAQMAAFVAAEVDRTKK